MLTDFQNSFTVGLSNKIQARSSLYFHLTLSVSLLTVYIYILITATMKSSSLLSVACCPKLRFTSSTSVWLVKSDVTPTNGFLIWCVIHSPPRGVSREWGSAVWTTCLRLLRSSVTAGPRTHDPWIASPTPYRLATAPPHRVNEITKTDPG